MDRQKSKNIHVTLKQKKRLLEFITANPFLIKGTLNQDFNYLDAQRLWQQISRELNDIPGGRKTWRQWRKTWQDLRSKAKKQQENLNGAIPSSVKMFTPAEQEALGLKNVGSAPSQEEHEALVFKNMGSDPSQETTEFVPLETDNTQINNFHDEMESAPSFSEPESPPETKVFTRSYKTKLKNYSSSSRHSNTCTLNCDLLAVHEERKLQLKEDFINYKKDYLRKKLKIMKEQTEALKTIARELSEK